MDKNIYLFDFDNTIADSLDFWYDVMDRHTFIVFGLKPFNDFKKYRQGKSNFEIAQAFIKINNLSIPETEVINCWNRHMEQNYLYKIKLIEGAKEYLLKLKNSGKRLVIVSATDSELLKVALKHFNIDIFEEIYTEANIGYPKHNPLFYKTCLKKLGAKADDVILYEDSLVSLKSATSLGIESNALIHKFNSSHIEELKQICSKVIYNYNNLI